MVIGSRFRPLPVGQYPCSGTQTEPDQDPPAPRRAGLFLFVAFAPTKPKFTDPVDLVIQKLRSEEHTSELQSLMRISYAVFCLKKTNQWSQFNSNSDILQPDITRTT